MLNIVVKNDTTLSEFWNDCLCVLSDVPLCFATILMTNGIQRHRVEVQSPDFAFETMVSGSVTSTPTHPWNKSVHKLLRVGLPPTPPVCYGPPYVQRTAFALHGFWLHSSRDFSGDRMLTGTRDGVRLPLQCHQAVGVAVTGNPTVKNETRQVSGMVAVVSPRAGS